MSLAEEIPRLRGQSGRQGFDLTHFSFKCYFFCQSLDGLGVKTGCCFKKSPYLQLSRQLHIFLYNKNLFLLYL